MPSSPGGLPAVGDPREHLDPACGLQHPLEALVADAPFRVAANLWFRLWKGTAAIRTMAGPNDGWGERSLGRTIARANDR